MSIFRNFTDHIIRLNDGTEYESEGCARISRELIIRGLPSSRIGTYYIVSRMVLEGSNRCDLVAPATEHPWCFRDEEGRVKSVPCFINSIGVY